MTEQEKAERFYKACGFQPYVFPGRYYYDQPPTPVTGWIKDGEKPLTLLPSTSDLNALFKYAVPVAMEKVVKENKGWTVKRAESYIFQAWLLRKQIDNLDFITALNQVLCEILEVE